MVKLTSAQSQEAGRAEARRTGQGATQLHARSFEKAPTKKERERKGERCRGSDVVDETGEPAGQPASYGACSVDSPPLLESHFLLLLVLVLALLVMVVVVVPVAVLLGKELMV